MRAGLPFCAQCGTRIRDDEDAPPVDPLLGQVLARKFKMISLLGEGGMGRVYRAEQLPLGTDVVVKTLHPNLTTDTMVVARFFREAQAASRLRHPNSVSILDFGDSDGLLYIAMEHLRGRTLARVLEADGRFEPRRMIRVVTQILDVIAAAHHMDIVHRDLKPDNVMLEDLPTARDFVKVLDFGIAKLRATGSEKLTQTGMLFGTPSYMAPEQAAGAEVDARSDLYAIGVIMFELLTGRVPFVRASLPMLLLAVTTEDAPPIRSIRPDVPEALAELIDATLSRDASARPQSALELKDSIERLELARRPATPLPIPVTDLAPVPKGPSEPTVIANAITCPRCGKPVPPTSKFCAECGARMGAVTPGPSKDRLAGLRRHLPDGVVDDLARMRVRDAGERRDIVVLLLDITGMRDEDADDELRVQLAELAVRHTGVLEARAGAPMVIAFGLTLVHADEAERAVEAALAVKDLVGRLNESRAEPLELTCVIHGGAAIVESAADGPNFTPVGDTLDLPTRLAASAPSGCVIATERVRTAVKSTVETRPLSSIRVKGIAVPVPVFEVVSAKAAVRPAPFTELSRAPFVGREQGLQVLLDATRAPQGQTIHVAGEPGIGKSRLLEELGAAMAAQRRRALVTTARPGPRRVSPCIAQLVDELGGTADAMRALGVEAADARVLARHRTGEFLGKLEDFAREQMVTSSLRFALEAVAAHAPICVIVDDVHLADRLTTVALRRLAAEPAPGMTLVTSARPGYPLPWDGLDEAGGRTATLARLDDTAIARLVAGLIRPTPAPAELTAAVVARSGGSPLMAHEVVRAMIDAGTLVSIGGRWTVVGDLAATPKPNGLRALYAARLDALPSGPRDLLSCAAVIGDEVPTDVLERVAASAGGGDIARDLEVLISRGLLAGGPPPAPVRFVDASAREAVHERLVKEARSSLNAAVAAAYEASATRPPEEVIAEHHLVAGQHARALEWFGRGATQALTNRELRRASTILGRARVVAKQLGATGARRLAEDSVRLCELALDLGDLAGIRAVADEAVAAAQVDDDGLLIARARRARGRVALAAAAVDDAVLELDAALAGAVAKRDRTLIADLHTDLGEAHERKGDAVKATDYVLRALELYQTAPGEVRAQILRALIVISRIALRGKEVDRAERFLEQALTLAEALGDDASAAKVLGNFAAVWHARGDFQRALDLANQALDLTREIGDLIGTARQLTNIGTLCALRGDPAAARRSYNAAFDTARRAGWREGMASAAAARDRLSSGGTPAR